MDLSRQHSKMHYIIEFVMNWFLLLTFACPSDYTALFELLDERLWYLVHPKRSLNVMPVWGMGLTGAGVTVAILDDGNQKNFLGIDVEHPDLRHAIRSDLSWNLHEGNMDVRPRSEMETHGTRCAGQIAARSGNCTVGVAWNAKIVGLKLLHGILSDTLEAAAVNKHLDQVDIYNCSWGPADDGKSLEGPGPHTKKAFINGILNGRRGLGAIYVFAAGNGAKHDDNCNADGYANFLYSFTI